MINNDTTDFGLMYQKLQHLSLYLILHKIESNNAAELVGRDAVWSVIVRCLCGKKCNFYTNLIIFDNFYWSKKEHMGTSTGLAKNQVFS